LREPAQGLKKRRERVEEEDVESSPIEGRREEGLERTQTVHENKPPTEQPEVFSN